MKVYVYTVKEVALELKVSEKTVYNLIHDQQIECIRVRGQIRITSKALNDFLKGGLASGEDSESDSLQEEQSLLR